MNNDSIPSCNWPVEPATNDTVPGPDYYVKAVLFPIILAINTVGNFLILVVLGTDKDKTSVHVYRISVAWFDLSVVWLELYSYLQLVLPDQFSSDTSQRSLINFYGAKIFWQNTSMQASNWTLIVFGLERLYATIRPLQFRTAMSIRRAIYLELVVVMLAVLYGLEYPISWYYALQHSPDLVLQDLAAEAQYLTPGLLRWNNFQNEADVGIQIGNWIAIFTIDCCLLIVLHRHFKTRKTLFQASERAPAASRDSQGSGSALRLVIACSALFVFTMALPIASNILLMAKEPPHCSYYITTKTLDLLTGLGTMSLLVNYSAGIFLYCLTWKRFRERIRNWVRLWFPTAARRERRSSSEMTVIMNGAFIRSFGSYGSAPGEFDCLAGIAVSSDGKIIISNRYNHRVSVHNPNGRHLLTFGSEGHLECQFQYPYGVAVSHNSIYVCDKDNARVQKFSLYGWFIGKIGGPGVRTNSLNNPHYVCLSPTGDRVFVSDSGNNRIAVFDSRDGSQITSIGGEGTTDGKFQYPGELAMHEND
ncbi:putative RING finger protein nhl-1 [Hypsibius exemplaris]|uniref:RING finger protein nhl-1 n=1 Tax=Hypsibius exemplaris TaxID=2072580 RepID=A0A1W0WEA9_HYPEX|nr:putative RING finger protein nhl-1 [Hypsibius exemplaris]